MSNLAQWSLVVAFFVPLAVSVLNQAHWPAQLKAAVFFVVSLLAAAGTAYFQGDLTGKRFVDSALLIVAAAAAFYRGWWKPVGVADPLESKTTVTKPPPP
jgi:uncharacterized protein YfiM (DUF2279 family)